jgi:transposase
MAAIAAFSECPVRLFFQDEARVGLHLPRYRRVTACGVCPVQPYQPLYEFYWLYGAVEPATGEAHFWEMPALNAECFSLYLSKLAEAYPETLNVVALDNAPAHVAVAVVVPENVVLLPLPPYSPELNPIERLWAYLKSHYLSNQVFKD